MRMNRMLSARPALATAMTAALTVSLVVSCSNNDNAADPSGGPVGDTVSRYGVLAVREQTGSSVDQLATFSGVFGVFSQSASGISADELIAAYRLPLDTCRVSDSPSDSGGIPGYSMVVYDNQWIVGDANISAGEILTLDSAAGSWLDLVRGESPDNVYAATDLSTLMPAPAALRIDIPGDAFPALSAVPIPDTIPLSILTPDAGQILTLETEFTWIAGSTDNSYIRLTAAKTFGSVTRYLDCMAVDDGAFSIPPDVRQALGELFNDYPVALSRTTTSVVSREDAILLVMHTVGTD